MRKVLPLFFISTLFLFLPLSNQAQSYEPLVVENSRWRIAFDDIQTPPPADEVIEMYLSGDTLLNGQTYLKLYQRDLRAADNLFRPPYIPTSPPLLIAALREEVSARKVYAYFFGADFSLNGCPIDTEFLLYDFSISIGDSITWCTHDVPEDSVMDIYTRPNLFSYPFSRLKVFEGKVIGSGYIEGVGSQRGLFQTRANQRLTGSILDDFCRGLPEQCDIVTSNESELLYQNSWNISSVQVKDKLNIRLQGKQISRVAYDLSISIMGVDGKQVNISAQLSSWIGSDELVLTYDVSSLSGGLYIVTIPDPIFSNSMQKFVKL